MNGNMLENEFNENSVNKKVHNSDTTEEAVTSQGSENSGADRSVEAINSTSEEADSVVTADNTAEEADSIATADSPAEAAYNSVEAINSTSEEADSVVTADNTAEEADSVATADSSAEEADSVVTADNTAEETEDTEATVSSVSEESDTVFVCGDDGEQEASDSSEDYPLSEIDEPADDGEQSDTQALLELEEESPLLPCGEDVHNDENEENDEKEKEKIGNRFIDSLFDFVELFIFSLAAVFIITTFFFRHSVVDGTSMEKTLFHGEHIIISDLFYNPKRGDIIVCEDYSTELREPIVKRVIAVEGDTIEVALDGSVKVNGELLDESEYVYMDSPNPNVMFPINDTVPEGHIFVMGDHRNVSKDSRAFGYVHEDSILGKVLFRFYPFDKFGKVE